MVGLLLVLVGDLDVAEPQASGVGGAGHLQKTLAWGDQDDLVVHLQIVIVFTLSSCAKMKSPS